MQKPFIVCHMMMSIDGRIDCRMTEKIKGVDEYYETLKALDSPTTLSGRVTAQLELAQEGEFQSADLTPFAKEGFSKKIVSDAYSIVVDTKGTLLWTRPKELNLPLIVITSEKARKAYLDYLDSENISWIATGSECINLARACEILVEKFDVKRMAIVGGGHINASFLEAGLLDEVSLLIGPGIDGRGSMAAVFDGLQMQRLPTQLKLKSIKAYENGAVHLSYKVL